MTVQTHTNVTASQQYREYYRDCFKQMPDPACLETWKYFSFNHFDTQNLAYTQSATIKVGELKDGVQLFEVDDLTKLPAIFQPLLPPLSPPTAPLQPQILAGYDLDSYFNHQPFVALNHSYGQRILGIYVPPNHKISAPLTLDYLLGGMTGGYSQIYIYIDQRAELTTLEQFVADPSAPSPDYYNHVAHIYVADNATLEQCCYYNPSTTTNLIATNYIKIRGNYRAGYISMGGSSTRLESHANLLAAGAQCHLNGASLGSGTGQHSVYLPVYHTCGASRSQQNWRQVLSGKARGIFYGRAIVPNHSHDVEAHQLNRNLILDKTAVAFTRPELEVFTDKVKCSHGASVAHIDDIALYYLQSRGIPYHQAVALILESFISEPFTDFALPLFRKYIHEWVTTCR